MRALLSGCTGSFATVPNPCPICSEGGSSGLKARDGLLLCESVRVVTGSACSSPGWHYGIRSRLVGDYWRLDGRAVVHRGGTGGDVAPDNGPRDRGARPRRS